MLKLYPYILRTERQELGQRLRRVGVGNALHKLMDSAHGIRANVVARKVEDHMEHHVVKWFRKVYAYLTERPTNSIHQTDFSTS